MRSRYPIGNQELKQQLRGVRVAKPLNEGRGGPGGRPRLLQSLTNLHRAGLPILFTRLLQPFVVQYLPMFALARCRWNDSKRLAQGLEILNVLTCQLGSNLLKSLYRLF